MLATCSHVTRAQPNANAPAKPTTAPAASADAPLLKPEELEQMLAAVALYPDSVLTQILMASTYPLEVVQAQRWADKNKNLKGDALTAELEKQSWDPSVKSLVQFPDVLKMMSDNLDTTVKIGDAFIAQQADVMNTIQKLRAAAKKSGNLQSNEQQTVTVSPAPPPDPTIVMQQPAQSEIIVIESSQPDVIYLPSYNPTVVYGTWPYPAYPPYPYYPPNYVASNMMSFGVGMAVGAAWGYAWGNCDWGHHDCEIDIDKNTNINTNIDRDKYKQERQNRQTERQGQRDTRQGDRQGQRQGQGGRSANSWQHDPSHRGGVAYRDQKTAQQFGARNQQAVQAREQYRGRAEAGRQDIARGGADQFKGSRPGGAGGAGGSGGSGGYFSKPSPSQQPANRPSQNRPSPPSGGNRSGSSSGGALNDVNRGGSSAKSSSQRGKSSRSSSSGSAKPKSSGGSRSPSRSSGSRGGSRGGGGGGARGGRR
jgi:hypothetical protein